MPIYKMFACGHVSRDLYRLYRFLISDNTVGAYYDWPPDAVTAEHSLLQFKQK